MFTRFDTLHERDGQTNRATGRSTDNDRHFVGTILYRHLFKTRQLNRNCHESACGDGTLKNRIHIGVERNTIRIIVEKTSFQGLYEDANGDGLWCRCFDSSNSAAVNYVDRGIVDRTPAVIDPIARYLSRIAIFAYPTCIRRPH